MDDWTKLRVTWQSSVVISSFLIAALAGGTFAQSFEPPLDRNAVTVRFVAASVVAAMMLLAGLAIWVYVARLEDRGWRREVTSEVLFGVGVMVVTTLLSIASFRFATFEISNRYWTIIPAGGFLWGLIIIVRTMPPRTRGRRD